MRKSTFILAPVALILLAASGSALAAGKNATLSVTANISKTTCDVNLTRDAIDLGNFTKADFSAANPKEPIKSDTVTVSLANCQATTEDGTASLIITGETLAAHADMFNISPSDDIAIMVADLATPDDYIKKNEKIKLEEFTSGNGATAPELNALTKSFTVGVAKTVATGADPVTTGSIRAPITFQFDYN
ncbi:fimbrial protein [Candidatus Pantoea multigeneris]|uniref:Type 1 fimbrial protein n=1 Tax=Candidatus Pantoea multigeneris TaxID=2608357 RepID=A0ABX0RDM5_9GAMM|nr:fimbrial protein [Pantoea multigeneris]NIF23460.1 type 1 fimbrial protein [Pantoea multigeneris]